MPIMTNLETAIALLKRAQIQLVQWQMKYGAHLPDWLPPSGDIRLSEDLDHLLSEEFDASKKEAAIRMLVEVAQQAYHTLDDCEEFNGTFTITQENFTKLSNALDALDSLPDDRHNVSMTGPTRAAWLLLKECSCGIPHIEVPSKIGRSITDQEVLKLAETVFGKLSANAPRFIDFAHRIEAAIVEKLWEEEPVAEVSSLDGKNTYIDYIPGASELAVGTQLYTHTIPQQDGMVMVPEERIASIISHLKIDVEVNGRGLFEPYISMLTDLLAAEIRSK